MAARRRVLPLLILLSLAAGLVWPAGKPSRQFHAGRPLTAALSELRAEGLDIVYSSDLVRSSMRVLAEPVSDTPRAILDELIAPHGLTARDGPNGTLLIVQAEPGAAPAGGIAGRVVGSGDRRPIPGARVAVEAGGDSSVAVTAADGRFLLFRLAPGSVPLEVVSADGQRRSWVEVAVKAGEMTRVVLELTETPGIIEGIVVTPTRYRIVEEQPETRRTLEAEEMARLAHMGDDAQRAVSRLPGTASGDKSARFSLRGGEWNETLILLDGFEIDEPFHLRDFLAFSGIIDSRAIERTDLLAGGFPVEFGDRMSGVMELTSSEARDGSHTSVGAGTLNSWVLSEARTRDLDKGWLVAARAWYPDAVLDLVDPGGEDLNPGYYDLLGKMEWRTSQGTIVSGHVLAARHLIKSVETELGDRVKARSDTGYAWVNLETPWTARLFSLTQLSVARLESNRHGETTEGNSLAEVTDDRTSDARGLKQDWVFRASENALLKWGFNARDVGAGYDYTSHAVIDDPVFTAPGPPRVVDRVAREEPSGHTVGVYAAARGKLLPALTAELGLRWARQSYSRQEQLEPRVNLVIAASEHDTVRAAWGQFHQPQRVDELQVEDGVTRYFPAQLAEHRVVSWEHDSGAGVFFRVDAYWKTLTHLRPRFENLFNPIELLPETEGDRVEVAPDRGLARGLEVLYERSPSRRLTWWTGYALSSARDTIDGRTEPRSWDQTHALNTGLALRFGTGWELDLAGVYHSGWPTTSVSARSVLDPNGMTVIEPALGERNAERYPPYHRLDFKITKGLDLPKGSLSMFLEVLNVYDRNNVCCVDAFHFDPASGGDVRVVRREGSWQGRVPSAGVSWEF